MKKFWMMLLAAVALTGCQKSEDVVADTNQITIKATMRFDAAARTTIKEQDGNYLARWTEEDKDNIKLVCIRSDGAISMIYAKDIHLENDGETATFEFAMYPEMMADSWTFVAASSFAVDGANSETVWLRLKDAQTQDGQNYYDAHADLVVSKPIPVEQLTGDLNLNFTMARMNALLKLSLKNFTLAEEEKIQSVTFACEQPLAGIITVNFADLDGVTYPIPYTLDDEESKSITFDLQAGGDLYISTLPATLKAGESYTVTVKTNQATYHKVATLPADLTLTAGDITSVVVNMGDAATKSKMENLSEEYEYAIGFKAQDGTVYLMKNEVCDRRPIATTLATLGLSADESGTLVGEVPADYRWRASTRTDEDGVVWGKFMASWENKTCYLINTYYAQGLAISYPVAIANDTQDGFADGWTGYSGRGPYTDEIRIEPKEDGYRVYTTNGTTDLNICVYSGAQFRLLGDDNAALQGVVYFYRLASAPQKSLYPVITKSAHVTDGTYLLLFQNASTGAYYTMSNAMTLTAPAAVAISEIGLTMENGMVTAADVAADYQWIIAATETGFNIKSASDATRFLRQKNNAGGIAVVTNDEYDAAKEAGTITGVYEPNWTFIDHLLFDLQAFAGANERHLGVNAAGTAWAGFKESGLIGHLVLVKLSDSTKQIAENE
ncbi:MAG: hypothetical protein IJF77_04305 [Alistipes sp.]|nr:hypothetical protein [Alistipes sp.]